ncbi:MAG: hypothetical protein DRN15_04670 [Thermoprotei archaeon]|nr:MAG: hypothetical protein DRN15_04670 [Thermoprotei archaeon]
MVVRVKVRLVNERKGISRTIIALVEGGAESPVPVVMVSSEDAKALGLDLSRDFELIEVELALGRTCELVSRSRFKVELLDGDDNVLSNTRAYLIVSANLNEPLMTDTTIDELGIQVISFRRGLWRHVNDPSDFIRRSAFPFAS